MNRPSRNIFVVLAGLILTAAAFTAHAVNCQKKPEHPQCAPDFTITFKINLGDVALGDGVEGSGATIDGLIDAEIDSFTQLNLDYVQQDGGGTIREFFNSLSECTGNEVAIDEPMPALDNVSIHENFEDDTIDAVFSYEDEDGERFILILGGNLNEEANPDVNKRTFPLKWWNNRGGGKGRSNTCKSGDQYILKGESEPFWVKLVIENK